MKTLHLVSLCPVKIVNKGLRPGWGQAEIFIVPLKGREYVLMLFRGRRAIAKPQALCALCPRLISVNPSGAKSNGKDRSKVQALQRDIVDVVVRLFHVWK
jgi:hypothetical protein